MDAMIGGQQPQQPQQPPQTAERLNSAVQQQLNLDSLKTRAVSLYKAISRIIEDLDLLSRSNALPKWQDVVGQFSMVNLELFSIVEEVKKVSKAFVVYPRNVNAENATILPVMLSSKLLPEIEMDDNSKKEQLLLGMQNLPVTAQIDKLKARIDMIAAACESAEKVIADTRKAYGLDTRQRPSTVPTVDKALASKIQEQENLLRAAVNHGEGLRLPVDQRHITSPLPSHLVDVLTVSDVGQTYSDGSGMYSKNTPTMSSGNLSNQGTPMQVSGGQLLGRSVPSPSTAASSFDNTASPLPYANSPRSGSNMMNAPSPQQQALQQQQLQQQRQKLMQLSPQQQQQFIAQQQYRQSAMQGLGQNQLPQLHDMQTQAQQKFQSLQGQNQMQFSQPIAGQQFQSRQLGTGQMQHGIGQSQLSQGSQLNRHIGQFSGPANTALYNAAQSSPNTPMISNMSAAMASQSLLPRMQFPMAGGNSQRTLQSQMLSDQIFNMGGNPGSMMTLPQQQQVPQGAFGAMPQNSQNLQSNMVSLHNTAQNLQNFQQRQQNQNQNQNQQ